MKRFLYSIIFNTYYIIKLYFIITKNCLQPNMCDVAK